MRGNLEIGEAKIKRATRPPQLWGGQVTRRALTEQVPLKAVCLQPGVHGSWREHPSETGMLFRHDLGSGVWDCGHQPHAPGR